MTNYTPISKENYYSSLLTKSSHSIIVLFWQFLFTAYMGPKATTDDHIERSFGVNYLGHFLLTKLLIEKLHKNAPSRVINVVSDSYQRGKLDFQDLAMHHNYSIYRAYARSKLSQAIHTLEMHRRFFRECIWTFAVHPGT